MRQANMISSHGGYEAVFTLISRKYLLTQDYSFLIIFHREGGHFARIIRGFAEVSSPENEFGDSVFAVISHLQGRRPICGDFIHRHLVF